MRSAHRAALILLFALSACALTSSYAFAQHAPDEVTQRFDQLISELSAQPKTPVALAKLQALGRLRLFVPSAHVVSKLEEAKKATKDPLVYAALSRFHARAKRELGPKFIDPAQDRALERELGCLTQFQLVGPLENSSMDAFESALGPELGESEPYAGKQQLNQRWRPLPAFSELCSLNLSTSVNPSDSAVAYLSSQLQSPKRAKAKLLIGAAGAYRVWLNGKLVGHRREDAGLALDNDAWSVELNKGENQLLIKAASEQDSGMELIVRLVDDKLKPMSAVEQRAAWSGQRVSSAQEPPQPAKEGVLAQLRAMSEAKPSVEQLWASWLWQSVERKNAATPWRDVAQRLEGALDDGSLKLPGADYALLAELYEEHYKRLALLERAQALHPQDPWVEYNLLNEYADSLSDELRIKRRGRLEALIENSPRFSPAVLALVDWYEDRGLDELALKLLKANAIPGAAPTPRWMMMELRLLKDVGSRAEHDALEAKAAEQLYISGAFAWAKINDMIKRREHDQALEAIRAERARQPWSTQWLLQEIEVLRAQNNLKQALAVLDEAIKTRPGDVFLLEQRVTLLLAADQRELAAQAIEQALQYKPQDQELREQLAHLRPDADRFHEPWMQDDPLRIAKLAPVGPFHTTTIIDQKILQVASNGLAQQVTQLVERVNDAKGIDDARVQRIYYQVGDERVDILRVRVHKPDGTITEDYDLWNSDDSRKGSTTYNDNATITIRANNVEVGDLIEIRYKLSQVANQNFRGDYFGDISYIQGSTPIVYSRYAVIYPKDWQLYFKPPRSKFKRHDDQLPNEQPAPQDTKVTSFELWDVAHVATDADQPGHTSVYDYILVSNKKTWDEIGHWWWNLVKEQLIVDENIRAKVQELVKGKQTELEKVQAIHNYVVQNTRYLHVGLGIHGWKPYRTTTCFRNRYGDCKDKASLLKVMLEEAGVKANLVLVRTRRLGLVEAQPASMHIFNHAITYVPGLNLYLDGTAEFNGTKELTPMDQGAQALVVEDGGKTRFVTLPVDKAQSNLIEQTLTVDLSGAEPVAQLEIVAHGNNAVYYRTALEDPERRDEVLEKQLAATFPGAKLVKATYSDLKKLEQPVKITCTFKDGQLVRSSADREYIYPYGAPRDMIEAYASQQKRDQDLVLRVPYSHKAKVTYKLSPKKSLGALPDAVDVKTKFGHIKLDYVRQGQDLLVELEYSLDKQQIAATEYPAWRQFITQLHTALNATVGLEKER